MANDRLGGPERARLLALVREALAVRFRTGREPSLGDVPGDVPPAFREPCGAFVSIYAGTRLRGCRGRIGAVRPLVETVMEMAVRSALDDPRFDPVTVDELPRLRYSLSLLGPPRVVTDPAEIELGRHGVILDRDGRRAVFLPQVATQAGWDVATLLARLSQKAGLSPDAWREGARLSVFEAEIVEDA